MVLRCVVYMRKSSKDSDENKGKNKQKYSLERQKKDLKKYFESQSIINKDNPEKALFWAATEGIDWFREDSSGKVPAKGYEGKKINRPQFLEMIKLVQKDRFDVLICTELSRLSRNAEDTGTVVQLLDPYKEKPKSWHLEEIRTIDKVFTKSATDKFTLSLFMSVAKFENDQRAKNTSSGMSRKRASGGTTGKAPFGYINKGEEKGDKYVEIDTENFDKFRELWEMLISGEYDLKDIYKRKKQLGMVHFYNGKERVIGDSQIRDHFTNKYYAGMVKEEVDEKTQEETWIQGSHQAMVTIDEFTQAQISLQKKGFSHAKYEKSVDIGTLIASFAESGEFSFTTADGVNRPSSLSYTNRKRYTCSCTHRWYTNKADNKTECPKCQKTITTKTKFYLDQRFTPLINKKENGEIIPGKVDKAPNSIRLEDVVKMLEKELSKLYISDDLFIVLRKQLYTLWLDNEKVYKKERDRLIKKSLKLEDEESNLKREQFSPDNSDKKKQEAIESILSVQNDLQSIKDQIETLKEEHEESFEKAWQRLQVLRDTKDILKISGLEPKKSLLLSLGSNLKISKEKVEMKWRFPFDLLAQNDVSNIIEHPKNGINYHLKECGSRGRI